MATDEIQFRLSVWRPHRAERPIALPLLELPFRPERLQEEIYRWTPRDNQVWGSISDATVSKSVRDVLMSTFAPDLPPDQRSVTIFRRTLTLIEALVSPPGVTEWQETAETTAQSRTRSWNLRGNGMLAGIKHLDWIASTFEHVPGASVTIR